MMKNEERRSIAGRSAHISMLSISIGSPRKVQMQCCAGREQEMRPYQSESAYPRRTVPSSVTSLPCLKVHEDGRRI
jgi:hypothetical protein